MFFHVFSIFTPIPGEMIQLDYYFSNFVETHQLEDDLQRFLWEIWNVDLFCAVFVA